MIRLHFDAALRQLTPASIDGLVLDPATDFTLSQDYRGLKLHGNFQPGHVYQLKLAQGWPFVGEHRLAQDITRRVTIPDLDEHLKLSRNGNILSSQAEQLVPFDSVNVTAMDVSLQALYPHNEVRFAQDRRYPDAVLMGPAKKQQIHY